MRYIYLHRCLMCAHELIGYIWPICSLCRTVVSIYGYSMENESCSLVVCLAFFSFNFFTCMCSNVGPTWRLLYMVTWTKSHVASYFNCLDPRNTVVPLMMMMSASCNANATINGVTWPEKSFCISFQLSWPKECNGTLDINVGIIWHHHWW